MQNVKKMQLENRPLNKIEVTELLNSIEEKQWISFPAKSKYYLSRYQQCIYFRTIFTDPYQPDDDYDYHNNHRIAIQVKDVYYITKNTGWIRKHLLSLGFPLINPLIKELL